MLRGMKRVGVALILLFAFLGIADSTYLAQHELKGTPLLCTADSLSDCNVVVTSEYSRLFGVPIAGLGVLFYGIMFVLAALELVLFDQLLRRALQIFSLVGIAASLYFTFVQVAFIGALCIYCLASTAIALLIFIFASLIEPMRRRATPMPPAA